MDDNCDYTWEHLTADNTLTTTVTSSWLLGFPTMRKVVRCSRCFALVEEHPRGDLEEIEFFRPKEEHLNRVRWFYALFSLCFAVIFYLGSLRD